MSSLSKTLPLVLFVSLLGISMQAPAEDAVPSQYTAVVTGIVCQNCKDKVTAAMKKLPGVTEVAFAKGEKPGTQKLTFSSTSGTLAKSDAESALGEHAKEFAVVSFERLK